MKSYDVVVIGAGDVGLGIVFKAVAQGLKVALVGKGPVGGTCLNYGCVPSKTLIYAADRISGDPGSDKIWGPGTHHRYRLPGHHGSDEKGRQRRPKRD